MAIEGEVMSPEEEPPVPIRNTSDLISIMIDEIGKLRRGLVTDTRVRAVARGIEVICQVKKLELQLASARKEGDEAAEQVLLPGPRTE